MKVICFGNRGSHAIGESDESPFAQYGGDTTSIGIICDDGTLIALDAGSGAWKWWYTLQNIMGVKDPIEMHMFFSHYHDYHKTGFSQLRPLFMPENVFHLYGPAKQDLYPDNLAGYKKLDLAKMFRTKTAADNPDLVKAYQAKINLHTLPNTNVEENRMIIGDGVKISWLRVGHGLQGSFGYRIDHNGQSFTMFSDMHHEMSEEGVAIVDENIMEFARGSDALMADSHFTDEVFNSDPSFFGSVIGHSTGEHGIRTAAGAGVPIFMPHHYAPDKTDADLNAEMNDLRQYARQFGDVSVVPSQPSLVLDLSVAPEKRVAHMLLQSTPAHRRMAIRDELRI